MKAYRLHEFGGPASLRLDDIPVPEPGARQVRIRVRAASLNYRDLMVSKGIYNPKFRLPLIPLSDAAGEISAVGQGVSRYRVGDRVVGAFMPNWLEGPPDDAKVRSALGGEVNGMLAEEVVLPESGVLPIPSSLSFEDAATLPCAGVTAWNALVESGGIRPGDSVLVQGTGGVSIFALQFAARGARVIATSSSDEKLPSSPAMPASCVSASDAEAAEAMTWSRYLGISPSSARFAIPGRAPCSAVKGSLSTGARPEPGPVSRPMAMTRAAAKLAASSSAPASRRPGLATPPVRT